MSPATAAEQIELIPVAAEAELDVATEVILRAFRGHQNAELGKRYVREWIETFAAGSLAVLARRHRRPAGVVVGIDEATETKRYRRLRGAAAAALLRRPRLLIDAAFLRMAVRRLRARQHGDGTRTCWYLALLGIDPSQRGTGVGTTLLAHFEAEGQRRRFEHGALHVRRDNGAALRFYERAGWRATTPTWPRRLRYEKPLIDHRTDRDD